MSVDTIKTLARKYENIVGLKQSYGDMDAVTELRSSCPNDFAIYSGDDSLTLPMLSLGAHGVISVASHLFGKEIKSMIRNFKTGDAMTAKNMPDKNAQIKASLLTPFMSCSAKLPIYLVVGFAIFT